MKYDIMQFMNMDILGARSPDRRKQIILLHAAKPDGLAIIDLLHELKLKESDRSGVVNNHLDLLVELGVLAECQVVSEYGKRKKKNRPVDGYRLCNNLQTLHTLVVARLMSLQSPYYRSMVSTLVSEFVLVMGADISTEDIRRISQSLECNRVALNFVLYIIFAKPDERNELMSNIRYDVVMFGDPENDPGAWCLCDDEDLNASEILVTWDQIFNHLDRINSVYGVLILDVQDNRK